MSFDPVSYAMGSGAGAARGYAEGYDDGYASGESDGYTDGYALGESEGYTEGYAAGADSVLDGADGKIVSGGELVDQTPYGTVTENGSYDTTEHDSVEVSVEQGYVDFAAVTGTLADPWGSLGYDGVLNMLDGIASVLRAWASMAIDGTAIGMGDVTVPLIAGGTRINAIGAVVDASSSQAFHVAWDENGLVSAYMEQDGAISDLSGYAGLIPTTLYVPVTGEG